METLQQLINVMRVQTTTYNDIKMQRFIFKALEKMNLKHETDSYGNIYVTKGKADLYPTMVCHIDTVHKINMNVEVIKVRNKLIAIDTNTMERYGIGGDDKVGIFITLQLLKRFNNFKAVFFKDEEHGCIGSGQANFDFFNDSTCVLQCDRKGINDFVNNISGTKLFDDKFQKTIQRILDKHFRKVTHGGITDVGEIAENNNVMVANMSCGYYDPHTENEYIVIDDVYDTLEMCEQILKKTSHQRWEMERPKYNYGNYNKSIYPYDDWYDVYEKPIDYNKGSNIVDKHGDIFDYKCEECNHDHLLYDETCHDIYCYNCNDYVNAKHKVYHTCIWDDIEEEMYDDNVKQINNYGL